MAKYLLTGLVCFIVVFTGCQKEEPRDIITDSDINIEILSGNNQSDTLGSELTHPVVLKVTKNNVPLANTMVKARVKHCVPYPSHYIYNYLTDDNGLLSYNWRLNGKIGDQTIDFIVLDSTLILSLDSVTAHAQGNYYDNAWQVSDCLPPEFVTDICQSGTGRLFCVMNESKGIFFSENNGISWQKLNAAAVNDKQILQVVAQGNEIFATSRYDGFYYSPDNGTTWENRSTGIVNTQDSRKLAITRSGKLFQAYYEQVYMSADRGLHWLPLTDLDHGDMLGSVAETSTGTLYIASTGKKLYKSVNAGADWVKLNAATSGGVASIFADDNDDLYYSTIATYVRRADIYKSTDGANTWQLKLSTHTVATGAINGKEFYKVNNFYYLMIGDYGIIKTADFTSYTTITSMSALEYLVTRTNGVFLNGPYMYMWYNMNP